MLAARLHGPRDMRVEHVPEPEQPGPGEVLLGVRAVGICGSDLRAYRHAGTTEAEVAQPFVLGHECAGVVIETGDGAEDGTGKRLRPGLRVAVDPTHSCGACELCQGGHPNLCTRLRFCGLPPLDGCLRERMVAPSRTCFPIPDTIDDASAALLEPLGVALHAVHLSGLRPADSVSVHGTGPIGLLLVQLAILSGADPVFAVEQLPWRLKLAGQFGGMEVVDSPESRVSWILEHTGRRGVDVAFEAGWAGPLVQEAAEAARHGGKVVLVGIPDDDTLSLQHSTARRKGLTILLSRRMKHTYPRSISLVTSGRVNVGSLISHRFSLEKAAEAFALNDRYDPGVVKVIIEVP